jgi:hypothetical protein
MLWDDITERINQASKPDIWQLRWLYDKLSAEAFLQ